MGRITVRVSSTSQLREPGTDYLFVIAFQLHYKSKKSQPLRNTLDLVKRDEIKVIIQNHILIISEMKVSERRWEEEGRERRWGQKESRVNPTSPNRRDNSVPSS